MNGHTRLTPRMSPFFISITANGVFVSVLGVFFVSSKRFGQTLVPTIVYGQPPSNVFAMALSQPFRPESDSSSLHPANLLEELPFWQHERTKHRSRWGLIPYPRTQSTSCKDDQDQDPANQYDPCKPTYLTNLPFELREEIYTHLVLASSFEFLRVCRSVNTQATPLLYKHGTYHIRAIPPRHEQPACIPPPSTLAKIQNLYISMPEIGFAQEIPSERDVSASAMRLLGNFCGPSVRRQFCHLDLQVWQLSERMARVLRTLVGFERIKVTVRLRPYETDPYKGPRPHDPEVQEEEWEDCIRSFDERLGPWLGNADWMSVGFGNDAEGSGNVFESMLFFDFYPEFRMSL